MSFNYKGFDLNDFQTPKPWSLRETQDWKDIIDTTVGDAITVAKRFLGIFIIKYTAQLVLLV